MSSLRYLVRRSKAGGAAAETIAGTVAAMGDAMVAAGAGRAERVHAIAQSYASVAARWQAIESARIERVALVAAGTGSAGLALGLATLVPRLIPYQYAACATAGSLTGLAVPLAAALVLALRRNARPGAKLAETAAQCRVVAALGWKLGASIDALAGRGGLDLEPRDGLDLVLRDLEREVDGLGRDLREAGGEGRHLRRDARLVPRHRKVTVVASDGRRLTGTIANLSVSGVAMTERLPHLGPGHAVTVGSRPAEVARVWDTGIAFTFTVPLDITLFSEDTVL